MKHNGYRDIRLVGVLIIILLSLLTVSKLTSYLVSVEGYSCTFDNTFSDKYQTSIMQFLHQKKDLKSLPLKIIATKIKEQFPLINSIRLAQNTHGILHLKIAALQPIFTVNHDFVLVQNETLFDRALFAKHAISSCKNILYKDLPGKLISNSCKTILHKLSKECLTQYQCVWEDETKTFLHNKENPYFSLLCETQSVPNEKILTACDRLKNQLQERGAFSCKQPKWWVADVRFKDQIVLFSDKKRGR